MKVHLGTRKFYEPDVLRILHDVRMDNPFLQWQYIPRRNAPMKPIETIDLVSITKDRREHWLQDRAVMGTIEDLRSKLRIDEFDSPVDIVIKFDRWLRHSGIVWCDVQESTRLFPYRHNMYGIFRDGKGVCASIAAFTNVVLNAFGVPTYTINGKMDYPSRMKDMVPMPGNELRSVLSGGKPLPDDYLSPPKINKRQKDFPISLGIEVNDYPENIDKVERLRSQYEVLMDIQSRGHAWNVVDIDGTLCHLDETFRLNKDPRIVENGEYFLLPLEEMEYRECPKWTKCGFDKDPSDIAIRRFEI